MRYPFPAFSSKMGKHSKPFLDAFEAKEPIKTKGDLFLHVRQQCKETNTVLTVYSKEFRAAIDHCLLKHYAIDNLQPDLEKFAEAFCRDVPLLVRKASSNIEALYRNSNKYMHIPIPDVANISPPSKKRAIDFSEASTSTQNKRARIIVTETKESDQNAIILAAIRCFQDQGKHSAAKVRSL